MSQHVVIMYSFEGLASCVSKGQQKRLRSLRGIHEEGGYDVTSQTHKCDNRMMSLGFSGGSNSWSSALKSIRDSDDNLTKRTKVPPSGTARYMSVIYSYSQR